MLRTALYAVIGFLTAIVAAAPSHATGLSGKAVVLDGDSLMLGATAVRLYGVDAFEARQTCQRGGKRLACGAAATLALRALTNGKTVTCEKRSEDAYGRTVAACQVDGMDLGAALVRRGHALAYLRYSNAYAAQEAAARAAGAGVWAAGTAFEPPWRWRAKLRGSA